MTDAKRVLLYDIETAPILATAWQKYETNLVWIVRDWYMLCFAYKWLGERATHVVALPDFAGYQRKPEDDGKLVGVLHELFCQADIVVAHNGDRFDNRKSNARFVAHGFPPPTPYRTVDTLKVARSKFAFTSNKLDDLGETLGLGRKLKTDAGLWRGCMAGDERAWSKMKRYNQQDVRLLEAVYLQLRGWMTNHPAMNVDRPNTCPTCNGTRMIARGYRVTKTLKYRRWQCQECGTHCRTRLAEKNDRPEYVV